MNRCSAPQLLPFALCQHSLSNRIRPVVFFSSFALCLIAVGCGSNGSGTQTGPSKNQTPPTNLRYPQASIVARVGTAITTDTPTVTGTVSSYTISPALPAGLSIDATSGTIAGTPTAASVQAAYTVTATNSGGSTTAQVQVKVLSGPSTLVDLGHSSNVVALQTDGTHVLSADANGHWVLWNYSTGDAVSSGDGAETSYPYKNDIALAGPTMVIFNGTDVNIYSTSNGQQIVSVPAGNWYKLASDGSYVAVGSSHGLSVYSAAGSLSFSHTGDYSAAIAFASPTQVLVAKGPAGSNAIESIAVPSGSSSVTPSFAGTFSSWFMDGQRFLTTLQGSSTTTVLTYSANGTQQAMLNLSYPLISGLVGEGNWISLVSTDVSSTTVTDSLQIYAIGSPTPAQTYPAPNSVVASGPELALNYSSSQMSVVDLSGSTPTKTDYTLPSPLYATGNFAANSASSWVVACNESVILDGTTISTTPRLFNYGRALSIAATGNTAAIATESGKILVYDLSVPTLKGTIPLLASKVVLSFDGGTLAAANLGNFESDANLHFYSLPSMALTSSLPPTSNASGTPFLMDFSLAGSGTEVGELVGIRGNNSTTAELMHPDGSGLISLASAAVAAPVLSPDGTLAVVSNNVPFTYVSGTAQLTIYKNGVPSTTKANAVGEGWIDNNHLLIADYSTVPDTAAKTRYLNSEIVDASGTTVTTFTFNQNQLPYTANPSLIQGGSVYDPTSNSIYSLSTGNLTFQGPSDSIVTGGVGAAGSSSIVYESSKGLVRIEPFQ